MAESKKLLKILEGEIKKKDDQKELENAKRRVKKASRAAINEVGAADEAVDSAKDLLETTIANPSASLRDILDARRNLALLEKDLEDLREIQGERF